MSECPDETEVAALLEGTLGDVEKTTLLAHAADCDTCRELLAELARGERDEQSERALATEDGWLRRYELRELLGAGGMGVVYAAYDRELDRQVALKMLRDTGDAESDPDGSRRRALVREARAMAKLSHPNVVRVFDVGESGARVFVTMELAAGGTLRSYLDERPRTFPEIAKLFDDAGRGLQAAHEAGLIHRDFKPENVLIRDGVALVTDFGLARRQSERASASAAARVVVRGTSSTATDAAGAAGTLRYMAPEQLRGEALDVRADVFSFAVAFWEACHDERPFEGGTVAECLAAMERGPRAPSTHARAVPRVVRRALEKALAFDRSARQPSMKALLAEWSTTGASRRGPVVLAGTLALAVAGGALAMRGGPREVAAAREAPPLPLPPPPASPSAPETSAPVAILAPRPEVPSASPSAAPPPERTTARKALPESPPPSDSADASANARGAGGVFVRPPY